MTKMTEEGVTVTLDFNGDGYPMVTITTNSDYFGDRFRPSVEVNLNDVTVHTMFDNSGEDKRWSE